MINLELNQNGVPTKEQLSGEIIEKLVTEVNQHLTAPIEGQIAISFASEAEIQRLNRMYRGEDKVTDVLSFSYKPTPDKRGNLGDVIICLDQARRQAEGDLELELVDLIVHGVLHVIGYDHEAPGESKAMFSQQDSIVANIL